MVRRGEGRPRRRGISGYRIAALVVAIGGHLGLGLFLMRPAAVWPAPVMDDGDAAATALELRFIRAPRSNLSRPPTAPRPVPVHAVARHASERVRRPALPAQAAPGRDRADDERRTAAGRILVGVPGSRGAGAPVGDDDGGFTARLHAAQRADTVHGVPGSDTTYAPGIHLIDPDKQGIGAVMRATQRLFGITSSHCVDVDVWKHLAPAQLAARHLSPDDVAKTEARYHCDEPPGLHF